MACYASGGAGESSLASTPSSDPLMFGAVTEASDNGEQMSKWRLLHRRAIGRPLDRYDVLALLLLCAFVVAGLVSISRASPTVDEPYHFIRGMAVWQTGDTRFSFAHPPLSNVISATPTAIRAELTPPTQTEGWGTVDPAGSAVDISEIDYELFRAGIMRGRAVQLGWGLACLCLLYGVCRREFGPLAAVFAVASLGLNPTFVAHNSLLTTDGPITFATFLLMLCAWWHGRAPTSWTLGCYAFALALAPVVKLSGLILAPLSLVVFAAARLTAPGGNIRDWRRHVGPLAAHAVGAGLLVILSINAVYGFDRTGLTVEEIREEPEPIHYLSKGELIDNEPLLASLPAELRVPLPYTYVYGLAVVRTQARQRASLWFLGQRRGRGHPAYVPLMLFSKTPVAWWILIGIVLVQAIRRRAIQPTTAMALGFVLVYALLASRSNAQLGARYLLPCYPFLALGAASCFSAAFMPRRKTIVALIAATAPLAIVFAQGQNIGWFNIAVGGRAGGHRISMVGEDWGQDLGRVAEKLEELDAEPLYYDRYHRLGFAELSHHGITAQRFDRCTTPTDEPAWIVIHRVQELRNGAACYPWRDRVIETYEVDDHVRIYRLGPALPPEPDSLETVPPKPEPDGDTL